MSPDAAGRPVVGEPAVTSSSVVPGTTSPLLDVIVARVKPSPTQVNWTASPGNNREPGGGWVTSRRLIDGKPMPTATWAVVLAPPSPVAVNVYVVSAVGCTVASPVCFGSLISAAGSIVTPVAPCVSQCKTTSSFSLVKRSGVALKARILTTLSVLLALDEMPSQRCAVTVYSVVACGETGTPPLGTSKMPCISGSIVTPAAPPNFQLRSAGVAPASAE